MKISRELRNRIVITIALLILVQIISHIPIPVLNLRFIPLSLYETSNFSIYFKFDLFSISALGLLPYLAASILVMTIFYLLRFKKALDEYKYQLHRYTMIITAILIIVQSSILIRYYQNIDALSHGFVSLQDSGILFHLSVFISLLGGTIILIWIAHLITEYGIGNGVVLVIGLTLFTRWIPAFFEVLLQALIESRLRYSIYVDFSYLAVLIFIIIVFLLSNWTFEIKQHNAQQSNQSFLLKFPLLLIGVFPLFLLQNIMFFLGQFGINLFKLSIVSLVIQAIMIISLSFLFVLINYQPDRLQQLNSRFFPKAGIIDRLAFDKLLIRIFFVYAILTLSIWVISLILQAWLKDAVLLHNFIIVSISIYLLIIVAIILDVYSQIKTHREMYSIYSLPEKENDLEASFCEECNKRVKSDAERCHACGANFIAELNCSLHNEMTAGYCCVVCSKPICDECAIYIKGRYYCTDHQSVEVREGWAKIYAATTFVEANFIEEFLKGNGITSKIFSNVMGSNYGAIKLWQLTPVIPFMAARWLGGGEIKVFVPAEDFKRSSKLLEEHVE